MQIGTQQTFNSNLVLGGILVIFVLLVPRGLVPSLGDALQWLLNRGKRLPDDEPATQSAEAAMLSSQPVGKAAPAAAAAGNAQGRS